MRFTVLATIFSVALISPLTAADPSNFRRSPNPIRGRYIVVLQPDLERGNVAAVAKGLASDHGGRTIGIMTTAIKAFGFRGSEQAALALARNPRVALVEEDAFGEVSSLPPNCSVLNGVTTCTFGADEWASPMTTPPRWNLDRIDQSRHVDSTREYSYTSNGSGVYAYVVDFGVEANHPEFEGVTIDIGLNMTVDPDLLDDPGYQNYQEVWRPEGEEIPWGQLDWSPANDPCGGVFQSFDAKHGTAVASALAGRSVGVAPGVTIVPVKVGSCDGKISKLATVRGFNEILKDLQTNRERQPNGNLAPAVVNSSLRFAADHSDIAYDSEWGAWCGGEHAGENGERYYVPCNTAMDSVVNTLIQNGITVVQAAGNQDRDARNDTIARMGYDSGVYAGNTYRVITVGGTMYKEADQYRDARWLCGTGQGCDMDALGFNPGSNWGPAVNIWAPAWNVRLALAGGLYRAAGAESSGTSFAAPLVAGAAARILQSHPDWTPAQVWAELKQEAENHQSANPDFDPSAVTNQRMLYIDPSE